MKKLFLKYPATFYYIVVMLISFILVIPMSLTNNSPFIQVQYAPAIGVLVFYLVIRKNDLFSPLVKSIKVSYSLFKWFILIILINLLASVAIALLLSIFGVPYSPWKSDLSGYFFTSLQILVGVIFEEIGWRGFLLPLLHKRFSLLKSALIVGVLWGTWHIPAYSSYGILGCSLFFIAVIVFTIFISFFYIKGKGSLILAIAAHFFINIFSPILLTDRMLTSTLGLYALLYGVISLLILLINRKTFFRNN